MDSQLHASATAATDYTCPRGTFLRAYEGARGSWICKLYTSLLVDNAGNIVWVFAIVFVVWLWRRSHATARKRQKYV